MEPAAEDLTGKAFGHLIVTGRNYPERDHPRNNSWRVRCVCGARFAVWHSALVTGRTKSCGCKHPHPPSVQETEAVLDLWDNEEMTQDDISARLGISVTTIKGIIKRARLHGDERATLRGPRRTRLLSREDQDARFCRAMQAAIDKGLENPTAGELDLPSSPARRYQPVPPSSTIGSHAQACIEAYIR